MSTYGSTYLRARAREQTWKQNALPATNLHGQQKTAPATRPVLQSPQEIAPATKSALQGSQSAAPAMKSALQGSQGAAPALKSALQGPQSTAPESTLQGPQITRLPGNLRIKIHSSPAKAIRSKSASNHNILLRS